MHCGRAFPQVSHTYVFSVCMYSVSVCGWSHSFAATWPVLDLFCVSMQVAERSLFLWNNEYIVSLVAQHRQVILPVVFNALESNARSHWNPAVHGLTSNVKKVFQDMDMNLWRECEAHYQQEEVWASTCVY